MKKAISLLLVLLLLGGCGKKDSPGEVTFYYPRAEYTYNSPDSVIASETRDNGGYLSTVQLLSLYLEGPLEETLTDPFPKGISVLSAYTDGHTLYVTVSDEMATLSGAPLILACACLGRTGMEITGSVSAQIRCETLLLDGKQSITVSDNAMIYTDALPTEETIRE